jgi:hypothetical protein
MTPHRWTTDRFQSAGLLNSCTLFYNYFYGTDYQHNGGHWADAAGTVQSTVHYRFTTRDGKAAVVRDTVLGWGFLSLECVQRPTNLYNDNDPSATARRRSWALWRSDTGPATGRRCGRGSSRGALFEVGLDRWARAAASSGQPVSTGLWDGPVRVGLGELHDALAAHRVGVAEVAYTACDLGQCRGRGRPASGDRA